MSGMAIKMVAEFFESQDVKMEFIREDVIHGGFGFQGGHMDIYLGFNDDEAVHVEGYKFINIPENKYDMMYKVINECNNEYRFVKFVLDTENGEINARMDAVIQLDSCGAECLELVIRMVRIVQDCYPKFMKALWA